MHQVAGQPHLSNHECVVARSSANFAVLLTTPLLASMLPSLRLLSGAGEARELRKNCTVQNEDKPGHVRVKGVMRGTVHQSSKQASLHHCQVSGATPGAYP